MMLALQLPARVSSEIGYVLAAFQLLTRLPVPQMAGFDPVWLGRGTAYFPLVGLIVGFICGAILLAAATIWPAPIPALLAVLAGVAVTGALHEDGLADTADGLGGAGTPEKCLEIMKDSRVGTYGALALVFAISLKVAALSVLGPLDAALALVLAHTSARVVPVLAAHSLPYVGSTDPAKIGLKIGPMIGQTQIRCRFATLCALVPFLLVPMPASILALGLGTLAATGLLGRAKHVLGGVTGDVLGAAEQMFEVAVLLGLSAAASAPG